MISIIASAPRPRKARPVGERAQHAPDQVGEPAQPDQQTSLAGIFAQIPATILADSQVGDADLRVLAAILSFAWNKVDCWPTAEQLARRCGKQPRAVRTALRSLEHHGLIRIVPDQNHVAGRRIILPWREEPSAG